jgi:hypothetical protein
MMGAGYLIRKCLFPAIPLEVHHRGRGRYAAPPHDPHAPCWAQVGFTNGVYHWPAFAGDTFSKRFIIRSVRTSSNNRFRSALITSHSSVRWTSCTLAVPPSLLL